MVDAVCLHLVQHFKRVGEGLGDIGEDVVHLSLCLEPLLFGVSHALGIVEILGGTQADEAVMGLGIVFIYEVNIIGAHHFHAVFLGQFQDDLVGFLLQRVCLTVGYLRRILYLMTLNLKVVVFAKDVLVPHDGFFCSLDVAVEDASGHLARNTCRAYNQALVVFLQFMMVGAWSGVETIDP